MASGDDLAGALVALCLGLVLDVPDDQRGLALGLVLDGGDQLGLGVVRGQPGDPLEFPAWSTRPPRRGPWPARRGPAAALAAPGSRSSMRRLASRRCSRSPAGARGAPGRCGAGALVLDRPDLVLDLAAVSRGLLGPLGARLTIPSASASARILSCSASACARSLSWSASACARSLSCSTSAWARSWSWPASRSTVPEATPSPLASESRVESAGGAVLGADRRSTTANALNARTKAASPITMNATPPLTGTPFVRAPGTLTVRAVPRVMSSGAPPRAHALARGVLHAVRLRLLAVVFGLSEPITRPAPGNASLR